MSIFDILNSPKPRFKIDKPVRLIELFSGIGSQAMALRDIGANFEHYRSIEFDKYAIASYNAIHGTKFPTMDVTEISGDDLGIVDKDKYCYILTYSFPCFVGNTLVLTREGYKPIKEVVPGDEVLTHKNDYQKVIAAKQTGTHDTLIIKGMGVDEIQCTLNHKFYVREKHNFNTHKNGKPYFGRRFDNPEWKEAKDLTKSDYLGVAINQKSIVPTWNGVDYFWSDGRKKRHSNELAKHINNPCFWWLIGRYVGDGWIRQQGGIVICCAKDELSEITQVVDVLNIGYSIIEERTVYKVHIPTKELSEFVMPFGRGAINKHIPGFMFDMPRNLLQGFIEGYLSADGHCAKDRNRISSISRELIYGTAQLIAKAYHCPYKIYKTRRNKTCNIEGRICNQHDSYEVVWKTEKKKQDKAFYENGYIWFPINSIVRGSHENVYDIEVEKDHSFMANGVIVHNCTDISLAGQMQGFAKGSGTRSSLLWEVERLLNEVKELPQVLLMENVSAINNKTNMPHFQKWIEFLESKGYSNYWQNLNSKDYGVAQSRNRCFMVSLLGNFSYEFPKPIPLTKTMKDYLEDEVDEKYYLTSDKAKILIDKLIKG
ncbi:MAG: DNA cytosine methyltransferase, partial [Paludibacteraceae bacterium]|nr:DNA cytosine methyltransferase [Paludibacteraceae bacterium]